MRVALASEGWPPYPSDTSMFAQSQVTLEALQLNGVDVFPLPLRTNRSDRVGGLVRPLLRRTFGKYSVPNGSLVHQITQNTLRGVDVVTLHDLSPFHEGGLANVFFRQQIRVAVRRAKRLVFTTEWSLREAARRFPRHGPKARVVPEPVRTPSPGMGPVEYDALWIGRNSPNKDLPMYLELARRFPERRFALRSSKSPGRAALDAEVAGILGRARNVVSIPRQTEEGLDRLYRSAPVLVATSRYEGFHLPAVESYLRGGKLVLPRIEPFTEIYPPDAVFWYSPEQGIESLVAAFREALEAPPRPPDPGLSARVSPSHVGSVLREIYEELQPR